MSCPDVRRPNALLVPCNARSTSPKRAIQTATRSKKLIINQFPSKSLTVTHHSQSSPFIPRQTLPSHRTNIRTQSHHITLRAKPPSAQAHPRGATHPDGRNRVQECSGRTRGEQSALVRITTGKTALHPWRHLPELARRTVARRARARARTRTRCERRDVICAACPRTK